MTTTNDEEPKILDLPIGLDATGKLEVHNRNEAVVAARRLGLLA